MIDPISPSARVLVTGAGGLIGSAVVERLLAAGHPVTALDLDFDRDCPADRVLTGDVTSPEVLAEAIDGADGVAHLAAIPSLDRGEPYDVFRVNTDATFNMLQTATDAGIRRFAIASSIQATGIPNGHHDVLPAYYPMDEQTPPDVADAYSLSKQVDEHTAAMFVRQRDIVVCAFRLPLTGEVDHLRGAARSNAEDAGTGRREGWSYLDTRDAAEAFRLGLTTPLPRAVHVLGIAAPDNIAGRDVRELVAEYAPGVPLRGDLTGPVSLYSSARAAELLGWHATHVRPWEQS